MPNDRKQHPQPVSLEHVRIEDGFWGARQGTNRERTIPAIYHHLEATGRLAAWQMAPGAEPPKSRSVVQMFRDSDSAKWIEAAAYSLHTHPDPALEAQVDALVQLMEKAQGPDGYLNSYFGALEPENKWANLRDWHEMYNAGHLIEGAVAYARATGKRAMLEVLSRYADHIDRRFGVEPGKQRGYPGHPELELALVRLYRATGEPRYLDLSKYLIDERGREPHYYDLEARARGEDPAEFWAKNYKYCQAHQPVRQQETAVGHAVRACYLYAGIADVALETGDNELAETAVRLWDDLTAHQMYITGGLGPAHSNEGFTFAYDLPNETAYAETCASIALAFWAQRMFHLDPHGRYIDVLERALYNNVLSGVSLAGEHFFYANPLAAYPNITPHGHYSGSDEDRHYRRQAWFFCPCCPPNLARIVASVGGYFYSTIDDRLYVHLYDANKAGFALGGAQVGLEQRTDYPWDGDVQIAVNVDRPSRFELALRVPGWCRSCTLSVNGERQTVPIEQGYAVVARQWEYGDTVEVAFDMPIERMRPHPEIRQDAGQVALQRGPLVYCLEEVDNGPRLANVVLPGESNVEASFEPDLLGGVAAIAGEALRLEPRSWSGGMYQPQSAIQTERTPFRFKAIPYALWANREPGEMRVWIRET